LPEWTKWNKGVLSLFCDSMASRKRPSTMSLLWCSRRMSSYTRVWRDSAGRLFWAWIQKRSHHRPTMMDSMKWTKEFFWLSLMNPFLLSGR
jgi:hypothetical protein